MDESSFWPETGGQQCLFNDQLLVAESYARQFGRIRREVPGVMPTGSLTLDVAMGIGGLPRGRIVELFGGPSVGKTTLALQMIAAVQRQGLVAVYVDAECSFDPVYAARVGVRVEDLVLVRAEDGQKALRIVAELLRSKSVDLVVIDSVAALLPPGTSEHSLAEANPFLHGEMMASGLRHISRSLVSSPACVVLLNQTRAYFGKGYTETSTGGWSVKIHASVRAELRLLDASRGCRKVRLRVAKTHFGEKRQMDFSFTDGVGIWEVTDVAERGLECGVISREQDGYYCNGEKIASRYLELLNKIRDHASLAAELCCLIRASLGMPQSKPVASETGAVQSRVVGL